MIRGTWAFMSLVSLLLVAHGMPVLAGEEGKPPLSELPYKYVGNSFSAKFHRPSCPFAKAMNARHVVLFHFRREAIEAGQTPCRYCLPPFTTQVRAAIIPPTATEGDAKGACKVETQPERGEKPCVVSPQESAKP